MLTTYTPLVACIVAPALACSTGRRQDAKTTPAPRCQTYSAEVMNGSRNAVSVFAMPPSNGSTIGIMGAFLGDVSAGSTGRFVLPSGMSRVRIQRERGVVPEQHDIQDRITCAPE